jgi:hypothetical protein
MSVSALSSSSSSYWEKMLAQMKSSSGTQAQDDLAGKLFGDLDSDGDGALSLAETGLSSNLYNSIDTDGDGSVSQTELQKAIETQRNAMQLASSVPTASSPVLTRGVPTSEPVSLTPPATVNSATSSTKNGI